jgi:hypothetical protein
MTTSLTPVDKILTPEQIDAFRGGFDLKWLNATALATVAGQFHGAVPTTQMLLDTFFVQPFPYQHPTGHGPGAPIPPIHAEIPPKERERVVIALFTGMPFSNLFMAIHIYWGLMEGLTPNDIAWTQLLTSTYRGINVFTNGVGVLASTLNAMKSVLPATDTPTVFGAIAAAFTPVMASQLPPTP